MSLRKKEAEQRARANWLQWRLLLSDMNITYSDLFHMDDEDIAEANAALDIFQKEQEKQKSKK
ncbi:hypothetical protein D3C86_1310500 [compost metagenome]